MSPALAELPVATTNNLDSWLTVPDVVKVTNLARTTVYEEINSGRLRSVKVRGSRRIPASALAEFMSRFDGNGEIEAK